MFITILKKRGENLLHWIKTRVYLFIKKDRNYEIMKLWSVQDFVNYVIVFIFHVKNLFILPCKMNFSKNVTYL